MIGKEFEVKNAPFEKERLAWEDVKSLK